MPILSFVILFILFSGDCYADGDGDGRSPWPSAAPLRSAALKPGIAAAVGILTTMFSITFLVLLYVKHCKGSRYSYNMDMRLNGSPSRPRRDSGINRKVIWSLPMFRFSSLRGQKEGLECAVCLNRFSAEEVLRLLPKCKHAFHVECVDTWLEAHSTCPLCRYRVDPEDVLLVDHSALALATPRTSDPRVSAGERGPTPDLLLRGRASLDSCRKTGGRMSARKDGQLPLKEDRHRLDHRIIISAGGEEGLRRWSDVQAPDSLYLKSEMLLLGLGLGLGLPNDSGSASAVINGRSVSEITGMSRYRQGNNGGKEERERQEEGLVKRWLAWISQSQHNPAVQSASPSPILL